MYYMSGHKALADILLTSQDMCYKAPIFYQEASG